MTPIVMGKRSIIVVVITISIVISLIIFYTAYFPDRTAQNIDSEGSHNLYNLNPHAELYIDPNNELEISELQFDDLSDDLSSEFFSNNNSSAPSFSYTDSAIWAKFQIENPDPDKNWFLELGYPLLEQVDLYLPKSEGEILHWETGNKLPFHERDIMNRNFVFNLPSEWGEERPIYLRAETSSAMILPFMLWEEEHFIDYQQSNYMFLGIYYGVILVIVLYTAFLYMFTRVSDYLYYTIFTGSMGFFLFTFNGLAFQYLWPNSPWWGQVAINFFMFLGCTAGLLFVIKILPVSRYTPRLSKVLKIVSIFTAVMVPLTLLLDFTVAMQIGIITVVVSACLVLAVSAICWFQGYFPAVYMFYGWLIFIIGIVLMASRSLGFLPDTFATMYGAQMGFMIKIVLLFLGLADHMNILRMQKKNAEQEQQRLELDRQKLKQAEKLNAMMRDISLEDDVYYITRKLLNHLNTLVPFQHGSFVTKENGYFNFSGIDELKYSELIEKVFYSVSQARTPLILSDLNSAHSVHLYPFNQDTASVMIIPISFHEKHFGVLLLESTQTNAYSPAEGYIAMNFADQASLTIENANLFNKINLQATTDSMTNLCNRRYFAEQGDRELERSHRYHQPMSVIILDIDDFKRVNDTWGHSAGDRVIQAVADLCRNNIRSIDIACRYGGEEFAIILPETNQEQVLQTAERLRSGLEAMIVTLPHDVTVSATASFGVATLAAEHETFDQLIIRADQALYRAKNAGKNQVAVI